MRAKAGVAAQLLRAIEPFDLADLGGDREREYPADPGDAQERRDVGVVGVALAEPAVDALDLALEVVDQQDRGGDVSAPGLGDLEAFQEPSALGAEEVRDRARAPQLISVE